MSRRHVIDPNAAVSAGASPGGCVNLAGASDSNEAPAFSWPPSRDTLAALSVHHTQRQIGVLYGMSQNAVKHLAVRLRIDWPRRRGHKIAENAAPDWPPSKEKLRALVAQGALQKEIAARYGVSINTLRRLMLRLRIKPTGKAGVAKRVRAAAVIPELRAAAPAVREPVREPPAALPPMPRTRIEKERDRVAGLLNLMPYRDITRAEMAMLRERLPMLAKAGRRAARRNVAEIHDPMRAA